MVKLLTGSQARTIIALWTLFISVSVNAATNGFAPLPDEVVDKLVRQRIPDAKPSLSSVLNKHLAQTAQLINDIDTLDKNRSLTAALKQTRVSNKLMLVRAKHNELQAVQQEMRSQFDVMRQRLVTGNLTEQLARWDALRARVEQRFDRLNNALNNLSNASSAAVQAKSIIVKQIVDEFAGYAKQRYSDIGDTATPSWRQFPIGPVKTEPASDVIPAYIAEGLEEAKHMLAANGDFILTAAAPPPTPTEASSCSYSAADLAADNQEIQLTTEITDLAEQLNYSPAKIFEYVANQIAFEPYYGSLKGAEGTLHSKSGGATDQASLLIALLRASNIPARYVRGTVDVLDATPQGADGRAPRWLGTKDYQAAANRLAQGGNPSAGGITNASSQLIGIRLSHVWVEACVPYAHYRGIPGSQAGHRWVPLDPSFKDKTYHGGIVAGVSFDYGTYLSSRSNVLPQEAYEGQIESVIRTLPPYFSNNTLSDVAYQGTIVPKEMDILPASLPYEVSAFTNWNNTGTPEASELPDSHRYKFNITVKNSSGVQIAPPVVLSYPQSVLDRVTLSYKGAAAGDQSALDAWRLDGDPNSAAPCTVNVVPVVKLEGVDQSVGTGSVGLCTENNQLDLSVTLDEARNGATVNSVSYSNISAAGYMALQGYAFQASDRLLAERADKLTTTVNNTPDPNTSLEETEGEFLNLVGLKYMRFISDANKRVGEIDGGTGDSGNHLGLTAAKMKVEYLFDLPFAVHRQGLLVDVPGGLSRNVDLTTGGTNYNTFLLGGYANSAYESFIWQENAKVDAVSTVRGLQFANENSIEVLVLDSANWAAESPKFTSNTDPALNYSSSSINSIKTNYIDQGFTVTVPRSLIQYSNWKGSIFVAENNNIATGEMQAAYIISGGYSGGYSVSNPPVGTDFSFLDNTLSNTGGYTPQVTTAGDPVNMVNGNMFHSEQDIVIPGRGGLPLVFERYYNSMDPQDGPLGFGWTHSYNQYLQFHDDNVNNVVEPQDTDGITSSMRWVDGTGAKRDFSVAGASGGVPVGASFTNPPSVYMNVTREIDGTYAIRLKNGLVFTFENVAGTVGEVARLTTVRDRNGNTMTLSYDATGLDKVSDDLNRTLDFTNSNGHISQIQDWTGRTWQYQYDPDNNLVAILNPLAVAGAIPPVGYDYYSAVDGVKLDHHMRSYTFPRGNGMIFEYYANGKVFRHFNSLGETTTFNYNDFRRESSSDNERGFTRRYFFDEFGNLVKLIEENGATRKYTYDTTNVHNRISKTDPMGLVTQYGYDSNGNVIRKTNPSGATLTTSDFTSFNQPGKIKDANDNYTIFQYDLSGNLTNSITLKQGIGAAVNPATYVPNPTDVVSWTTYTYDGFGNRVSTKRVRNSATQEGPTSTITYDNNNLYPVGIERCGDKDGDGVITDDPCDTENTTYDSLGRLTAGIRSDWQRVSYEYDVLGRIVRGTDENGQLRDYSYDSNNNPVLEELIVNDTGVVTLVDQSSQRYDLVDRLSSETNAGGYLTHYGYDAVGNLASITDPDNFSLGFAYDQNNHWVLAYDKEGHAVRRELDDLGRPRTVTDPNQNTNTFEYYGASNDGRLYRSLDALNREVVFDYDNNGNVISVKDNLGRDTITNYDELDRVVRVVQPAFTELDLGVIHPVTRYLYDTLGNLIKVDAGYTTDPANPAVDVVSTQATYTYDDFGRRLSETDAANNTWSMQYDVHGNIIKLIDGKGQTTERTYDYSGRVLTQKTRSSISDPNPHVIIYTRNALGQTVSAQAPEVTYGYDYDAAHRLTRIIDQRAGKTLNYSYSPGGLLNNLIDNEGNQTDYIYDPVGRLIGIWAPNTDYVNFSYDDGGRLIEKWFPNGINTQYRWNVDNTLAQVKNRVGYSDSNILTQHDYTHDAVGNRKTLIERIGAVTTNYRYSYDALNRLTEVRDDITSNLIEAYNYDQFHNRKTIGDGSTTSYYLYNAAQQLEEIRQGSVSGTITTAFVYDENGAVVKKCETGTVTRTATDCTGTIITTLNYDKLNRLAQVDKTGQASETYRYDDQGRRIEKTVGTTISRYTYNGPDIYAEYDNTWTTALALYTHGAGIDDPVIRDTTVTTQYYHKDGINSLVAMSDPNGATLGTQRFDVWGKQIGSTGSAIPQYGYTGREPDATGFVYYRARYYDPSIGRFAQIDPLGFVDSVNRYAYVINNPANATDPNGEFINFIIGAATSVAIGYGISVITGQDYSLQNALVDATLGAAGVGIVSKISKLNNLRKLNNLSTITKNRLVGEAAEGIASKQLSASGNTLLGNQVSVRTSEGLRRLDNLVRTPSGQLVNIEVKSGDAVRNAAQLSKDAILSSKGGTIIGRNAPEALRNTSQVITTQELNISRDAAVDLLTKPGTLSTGIGGGVAGGTTGGLINANSK